MLDLPAQLAGIEPEVRRAIDDVLASGRFILGPKVEELEARLAAYTGSAHAVAVSSGTDALLASLMALGIGPGDEVVTTAMSFFATAEAILRVGARPVFVDVDPLSMNLDVARVAAALTERTRAVIPVHLFGVPVDVDALLAVTEPLGIPVIEDAAQALGSELRGRRVGSLGRLACFSFFPSKTLGALGDGGMVTTSDAGLAARLRRLRAHGASARYVHAQIGGNFRLDALQASVLLAKLPHLERWVAARRANASAYRAALLEASVAGRVGLPVVERSGDRHAWGHFVLRALDRDALALFLGERGIATEVYYPVPLHQQPCVAEPRVRLPEAEAWSREALALPVHPELPDGAATYVAQAIAAFYAGAQASPMR